MELAAPLKEARTFGPQAYLAKVGPERRLRLMCAYTESTLPAYHLLQKGLLIVSITQQLLRHSVWSEFSEFSASSSVRFKEHPSLADCRQGLGPLDC